MTERPMSLPERPDPPSDDALTELFRAVRFTRAIYYTVDVPELWPAIQVPAGLAIAGGLGPRTRNVLSYHVIAEGSCWTGLDAGEPVRLERGDVIVYPRGDAYFLAAKQHERPPPADAAGLVALLAGVADARIPPRITVGPVEEATHTRLICGFLGCDPRPFDPLFDALPPILHVRGIEGRLKSLVDLALAEVHGAGGASVRERLSESMFIETVRRHVAGTPPGRASCLTGLRDPTVAKALGLLHGDPARAWTLATLAKHAGASRSVLADRFTKLVGHPPMQYLTRWRMQTAARSLCVGNAKVAEIALEVGYDSEAAFSRAFKKSMGVAPAVWRQRHATVVAR